MKATLALLLLTAALAVSLPHIDHWERANGFPFGKLCDLYNTCAR